MLDDDEDLKELMDAIEHFDGLDAEQQKNMFFKAVNFDCLPFVKHCENVWPVSVFDESIRDIAPNLVLSGSVSVLEYIFPWLDTNQKAELLSLVIGTGNDCVDLLLPFCRDGDQWEDLLIEVSHAGNMDMLDKILVHPLAAPADTSVFDTPHARAMRHAYSGDFVDICDRLAPLIGERCCVHYFNEAIIDNRLEMINMLAPHINILSWGQSITSDNNSWFQSDVIKGRPGVHAAMKLWNEASAAECQEQLQSNVSIPSVSKPKKL